MSLGNFFVGPPVIGFRQFQLNNSGYLCGCMSLIVWPPDKAMQATCVDFGLRKQNRECEEHLFGPMEGCTCGLYAYTHYERARKVTSHGRAIMAACAFWGKFEVHQYGFKAEKGIILALQDHKKRNPDLTGGWDAALARACEKYNVPHIAQRIEFEEYALTKGVSLFEYE